MGYNPVSLAVVAQMRRMRANGAKRSEIADAFPDLTTVTIWKYTRDIGDFDRRGRPRAFDHSKALRLREQGLTFREVGERLGVSDVAVRKACRNLQETT